MELHTIGIDLGKTVFHLVGLNLRGEVVVRKKFWRTQLLRFTANVHVGLIGMEACGGAHFLGRALREQRHEVRLIPAQYVKPYVKTNKTDYIDAEAIALLRVALIGVGFFAPFTARSQHLACESCAPVTV
jgi:transposase